jgi:hypothetical protein
MNKNINIIRHIRNPFISLCFVAMGISMGIISCTEEEDLTPQFNAAGFWQVKNDPTFTSNTTNATADLYHLFVEPNAFYRLSFANNFDFTKLNLRPRPDSIISFYKIEGNVLKIPNPAPAITNIIPGLTLESQSSSQMLFTRYHILRRSLLTGEILQDRTDKITYDMVTEEAKIAYFKNFISRFHQ